MRNQKGFASIVLVGVVVVLVAVAGYFVFMKKSGPITQQPTPTMNVTQTNTTTLIPKDNTSDWKIYTNQQYGFELKYPPKWVFCDNKDKTCNGSGGQNDPWVNDVFRFCDNIVPPGMLNGQKTIAYCNNPHLAIIIGKSSQPNPILPILKANHYQQQDFSIGGVKGIEFYTKDNKVFIVSNGAYTYQISSPQFPDDVQLADIISTFKFTK